VRSFIRVIWPLMIIVTALVLVLLLIASNANAHWRPGTHNATHAINLAFCGKANRSCGQGNEAIEVAECEASHYWDEGRPQEARNGQYRGMFQMGKDERETYGHGPDPWRQAFAAHRYYIWSGRDWSPWECKP
jgi:hypothetical protein